MSIAYLEHEARQYTSSPTRSSRTSRTSTSMDMTDKRVTMTRQELQRKRTRASLALRKSKLETCEELDNTNLDTSKTDLDVMRRLKDQNIRLWTELKMAHQRHNEDIMEHRVEDLARRNDSDIIGELRRKSKSSENQLRKWKEERDGLFVALESAHEELEKTHEYIGIVEDEGKNLRDTLGRCENTLSELQRTNSEHVEAIEEKDKMISELRLQYQEKSDAADALFAEQEEACLSSLSEIKAEKRNIERLLKQETTAHEATRNEFMKELQQVRKELEKSTETVAKLRGTSWCARPKIVTPPRRCSISTSSPMLQTELISFGCMPSPSHWATAMSPRTPMPTLLKWGDTMVEDTANGVAAGILS